MSSARRPPDSPTLELAIEAGVRLLSHRPRSEWEVRRRLAPHFPNPLVEGAISALRARGMLDDAAFARSWRQSRERQRPKAALALRWELRRKGVDGEIIDQALEGMDEEENAYRAAARAVPTATGLDLPALRRKLMPYLRRRGFGAQTAGRALRRVWEELSDPNDGDVVGESSEKQQE